MFQFFYRNSITLRLVIVIWGKKVIYHTEAA